MLQPVSAPVSLLTLALPATRSGDVEVAADVHARVEGAVGEGEDVVGDGRRVERRDACAGGRVHLDQPVGGLAVVRRELAADVEVRAVRRQRPHPVVGVTLEVGEQEGAGLDAEGGQVRAADLLTVRRDGLREAPTDVDDVADGDGGVGGAVDPHDWIGLGLLGPGVASVPAAGQAAGAAAAEEAAAAEGAVHRPCRGGDGQHAGNP